MNESIRAVVARFFNVPESGISDSFVLPPERLTGSISRRVLHAAIKRLAGEANTAKDSTSVCSCVASVRPGANGTSTDRKSVV